MIDSGDRAEFGDTQIRLPLRRFAPHMFVYLDRSGANVAVEWDYEVWDFLFSADLAAQKVSDGGWRCGWCATPLKEFATIEQLWADHLFEPLAEWLDHTLMPAEALYLRQRNGGKWLALLDRASLPPEYARFAVFASEGEDG